MKKTLLFILIPTFLSAQTAEVEKGIHFEHGTFAEILAKAQAEKKMIMIDAFTSWCGPCKWMAATIFPNDTVGNFYNKNFINAKIDMEKGEGVEIAKTNQVMCYPTYLFFNSQGKLVHRISGGMGVKEFIALGNAAMDSTQQFYTYKKKYDSGTATSDETATYITMRSRTCFPIKEEMIKYFSSQKESDLTGKSNWNILQEHLGELGTESREFKYVMDHTDIYKQLYGSVDVDAVIANAYGSAINNAVRSNNMEEYKKLKENILSKKFSFGEELILKADVVLFSKSGDWVSYANSASLYVERYAMENSNILNSIAWTFYENVTDKLMLEKAASWAKHSIELTPGYFNYDTYAAVLYKLGKKTDALSAVEKAIELAKKEGQDYKTTEALMEKIKTLK